MPVQGTALGRAIELAFNRLDEASSQESEGKAIILITDAEDQDKGIKNAIAK